MKPKRLQTPREIWELAQRLSQLVAEDPNQSFGSLASRSDACLEDIAIAATRHWEYNDDKGYTIPIVFINPLDISSEVPLE